MSAGSLGHMSCTASLEKEEITSASQEVAVRCCSFAGDKCTAPDPCVTGTIYEAEGICAKEGMRLCTPNELKSGICCNTVCDSGGLLTWQKDKGE